jgi:L-ascorbate metabolism protein UlaG (beta-lactamase superfamily)
VITVVSDARPGEPTTDAVQRPAVDGPALVWLGQAGWVLQTSAGMVVLDPYLSDSLAVKYAGKVYPHRRLHAAPVSPVALGSAKLVLCSHRHTDHMDAATMVPLAAAGDARFVVPAAWRTSVIEMGIDAERVIGVNAGENLEPVPGVRIRPVLAAHEEIELDAEGRSLYLGYVLTVDGVTLYHSGDCAPFAGQAAGLAGSGIDVALLPVNGRDGTRLANGVPGNFHPAEAVALASGVGAGLLVGMHFGLFDFNTVDETALAAALADLPSGLAWHRPEVGRRLALVRQAGRSVSADVPVPAHP